MRARAMAAAALVLATAGAAAGCGVSDPYNDRTATTTATTTAASAVPAAAPASAAAPARTAPTPDAAIRTVALAWANWTPGTLHAQHRRAIALTTGRAAKLLKIESAQLEDGVVSSPDDLRSQGALEALTLKPGADRRDAIVVTREKLLGLGPLGSTKDYVVTLATAERRADGWASTPLTAPYPELSSFIQDLFNNEGLFAFDSEVRTSIWGNKLPGPGSDLGLFGRAADGTFTPLGRLGEVGKAAFMGASDDLRRIFFLSEDHLLPADAARTEGQSIYELFNSELHLVDVNEDGSLVSTCGFERLNSSFGYSSDGQRVFFRGKPACGKYGQIYMRAGGHTTEISASRCTLSAAECGPEKDVEFVGATPSGSVAYFATAQRLTDDDTNEYKDLYGYEVSSGDLTLLTPRSPTSTASPFEFIIQPSDDGSRVYLAASGRLTDEGSESEGNVYLADAQGLRFIGSLVGRWSLPSSSDGRYVLFATTSQLVPADTDESADVYRYDATTDSYTEISAGADGTGNGPFAVQLPPEGRTPDLGQAAVFTTSEPLLPGDRNEEEDVYEWTEGGGLGLVSGGTPGFAAEYLSGTPDARTILFRTQATLLPRDRDGGELDIYAARVGGGFAESSGPAACGAGGPCEAPPPGTPHRTPPAAAAGGPFIGIAPFGAAARRQLVAKGSTTLLLEVAAAGRLTAQGRARVGGHRETVATGAAVAKAAGPVRLRLQLTKVARRSLAHGRDLRVELTLRLSAPRATRRIGFALEATR